MTAAKKSKPAERPENAARPCLTEMPYRAVVFAELNQHQVPLYFVGGSNAPKCKAEKALKVAFALHGGNCFYCKKPVSEVELSIDHVEPISHEGGKAIQNLLIAHRHCNQKKAAMPIEAFHPNAGREWLTALLAQVQDRLNRIDSTK
jgi:5-methylcytosine-specific restriction endonuclease McrA